MATTNPFDILGDDDNDNPSQLIASHQQKLSIKKVALSISASAAPLAKLPSKPLPSAQAENRGIATQHRYAVVLLRGTAEGKVFEVLASYKIGIWRAGVPMDILAGWRCWQDLERDQGSCDPPWDAFRGGRNGVVVNGNAKERFDPGRPPRRVYERRSGAGRGFDMKRDGAGCGNLGTATDDFIAQETEKGVNLNEKDIASKKLEQKEGQIIDASKDKRDASNEAEKKKTRRLCLSLNVFISFFAICIILPFILEFWLI
ncbi:hypothetical protein IEQ34_013214 [Dendrobium chrysotoxum]|uniref:Uncharacterized protein n=1 Tax=Dendrobium chrysotoxum TaxID=161865 RepID=A0AAV7GQC3_DENCH|nr:hypothetical protein IEQ34_013214 [Dendrobium chrysotoxum]